MKRHKIPNGTVAVNGMAFPPDPGTYALLLRLRQAARLRVGALGAAHFPAGWYVYVGSARGPGGLAARVGRHVRGGGRLHWHVDYLRQYATVERVLWRAGNVQRECDWARRFASLPEARIILAGFGASDCRCPSHLLCFHEKPTMIKTSEVSQTSEVCQLR